jgi:hypothetical protein
MTRGALLEYVDRFGYRWQARVGRGPSETWQLVFSQGEVRLVAARTVEVRPEALSQGDLKDLFCDAEREIVVGGVTWYVGYRQRVFGPRSRMQGGLCTRFRSTSGETRYSRSILDFRHMPAAALHKYLANAERSAAHQAAT